MPSVLLPIAFHHPLFNSNAGRGLINAFQFALFFFEAAERAIKVGIPCHLAIVQLVGGIRLLFKNLFERVSQLEQWTSELKERTLKISNEGAALKEMNLLQESGSLEERIDKLEKDFEQRRAYSLLNLISSYLQRRYAFKFAVNFPLYLFFQLSTFPLFIIYNLYCLDFSDIFMFFYYIGE